LDNKEAPDRYVNIHILELGYCNDWIWEAKVAEKKKAYGNLVAQMKQCGWKVGHKQLALDTRGSVYKHLDATLEWLGVNNYNTRKNMVKGIPLHGAREASKALRIDEELRKEGRGKYTVDNRTRPCANARGLHTRVRAKARCLRIHAEASLSL